MQIVIKEVLDGIDHIPPVLEVGFERISGQRLTFHKKGCGNLVQSCSDTIQILYQVSSFLPPYLCSELRGVFLPRELDKTPPCIQDKDKFDGCQSIPVFLALTAIE